MVIKESDFSESNISIHEAMCPNCDTSYLYKVYTNNSFLYFICDHCGSKYELKKRLVE